MADSTDFKEFQPENTTGHFYVKGIPLEPGEEPKLRLELREFRKNNELWNIFLLGLWQFQKVSEDHQLSYYQIAGIHGRPYQAWPKGDPILDKKMKVRTEFCTHTSILFLTWHRPYLALFESVLNQAIWFVAKQFTPKENREVYLDAAKEFRLPFWDWAMQDQETHPVFPKEATEFKFVKVKMPESMSKHYELVPDEFGYVKIENPLFAYEFPQNTDADIKIDGLPTTTRYKTENKKNLSPRGQDELLQKNLLPFTEGKTSLPSAEPNLGERLVYLVNSYTEFDRVSNNKLDTAQSPEEVSTNKILGSNYGSIEDIHNTVHVLTGGYTERTRGHMSDTATAAFDPIFWLHHANIDRIVSIWRSLNFDPEHKKDEDWVTSKKAEYATWISNAGDDQDLYTPLAPFYKEEDSFWTSDQVRETEIFGYSYPDIQSTYKFGSEKYRKDIREKLEKLYNVAWTSRMVTDPKKKSEPSIKARARKLAEIRNVAAPSNALTALAVAQKLAPMPIDSELESILPPVEPVAVELEDGLSITDIVRSDKTYLEWLFNIRANKHALDGAYQVHVFLGLDESPEEREQLREEPTYLYSVTPYHVGTFSPLGQPADTGCSKCKRDQAAGLEISGQIPLTIALIERYFAGWLHSFSEADIQHYLTRNLHWEVVDQNGQRLQNRSIDGLLVGVVSNEVYLPNDEGRVFHYSPYITVYPDVTTKEDGSGGRGEGTGITERNKYFTPL